MFFPPDDKPVARNFYGNAKAICSTCPVISECLAYGINEAYGVWGGTTPAERYEMRNRKAMSLNRPVLPPAY
jgi:WhiB family redox-sensing transcriptional regulator